MLEFFCEDMIYSPGFLLIGSVLITDLILVIVLFRLSISSWFNLERMYVSRNLFISSRLSNLLAYNCLQYSFIIFCIYVLSFEIFPLSFIILFIWVLSLFFLMSLARGLSISLIFLEKNNSWFHWSFLLFFFGLYFIYFLSDLYYILPSDDFKLSLCLFF